MNRLRWVMDGGDYWEVDVSTPITMDGVARPLPNNGPLPLGLSRGTRLFRPKQIDFFQRFMFAPVVPSFSGANGFSLQRSLSIPSGNDWFTTLLGQLNLQKFVTSVRKAKSEEPSETSWLGVVGKQLLEKSFYALNLCSEFVVTPDDTLLFSYEASGDKKTARKKAVYNRKFPHLDLTLERVWPGLFIDKYGNYWEVPVTLAADLASVNSDSDVSYHLCLQHLSGSAKQVEGGCCNCMVGENSLRPPFDDQPKDYKRFDLYATGGKSAFLADLFASLSFSAQYGNFQRQFFDLTRVHGRLYVPSGSKFLSAAACLAQNLYKSERPSLEVVQAVCPNAIFSLQQQIVGPFSFRVDSEVVNLKNQGWRVNLDNPVFAIEYALHVLFAAKAVAWYAPKQKEFMVELQFCER